MKINSLVTTKFLKICLLIVPILYIFYTILDRLIFSHDDEVQGWTRRSSRYIGKYMNEDLDPHIVPTSICAYPTDLLVVVSSRPTGLEDRQFVRKSWGQKCTEKKRNATVFFMLGETTNKYTQEVINIESTVYKDIIQEHFLDTYNNLTLKSASTLRNFGKYCAKKAPFLLKIDDDVIANAELITNILRLQKNKKNLLVGTIANSTRPYRREGDKWFLPRYLYPEDSFPDYLRGPGYLMSADVASQLYEATWQVPIVPIEDMYLTGMCAKKIGLNLTDHKQFLVNYRLFKDPCFLKTCEVIHYIGNLETRWKLWEDLQIANC